MKSILFAIVTLLVTACEHSTQQSQPLAQSSCSPQAACTGTKSCTACKNCTRCKHCAKEGGKCGVCK